MSADFPSRKQIRLTNYDYAQNGAYFVTICTQNRECLFGEIVDGKMICNVWNEIPIFYSGIELGAFVAMPNHIHGIVEIVGAAPCGRPSTAGGRPDISQSLKIIGRPNRATTGGCPYKKLALCDVVHRLKSLTTKKYADAVKNNIWPPFKNRIWQRNYYEHIIRNDDEYARICEYIAMNPENWLNDDENLTR